MATNSIAVSENILHSECPFRFIKNFMLSARSSRSLLYKVAIIAPYSGIRALENQAKPARRCSRRVYFATEGGDGVFGGTAGALLCQGDVARAAMAPHLNMAMSRDAGEVRFNTQALDQQVLAQEMVRDHTPDIAVTDGKRQDRNQGLGWKERNSRPGIVSNTMEELRDRY